METIPDQYTWSSGFPTRKHPTETGVWHTCTLSTWRKEQEDQTFRFISDPTENARPCFDKKKILSFCAGGLTQQWQVFNWLTGDPSSIQRTHVWQLTTPVLQISDDVHMAFNIIEVHLHFLKKKIHQCNYSHDWVKFLDHDLIYEIDKIVKSIFARQWWDQP